MQRIAVVGAGLAGARTCEELRSQGFDGSIVLLGAEPHLPYDRPPLSKALLFGLTDDTTLPVPWQDLDVDLRLGVTATGLQEGRLMTTAGPVDYDAAVLAVGARPLRLPGDSGSLVLRSIDDARALRAEEDEVDDAGLGRVGREEVRDRADVAARRGQWRRRRRLGAGRCAEHGEQQRREREGPPRRKPCHGGDGSCVRVRHAPQRTDVGRPSAGGSRRGVIANGRPRSPRRHR